MSALVLACGCAVTDPIGCSGCASAPAVIPLPDEPFDLDAHVTRLFTRN